MNEADKTQLAAYLSDDLPAADRAALEARLAGDAALRAELERIRRADAALAALPEVGPTAAFSQRLRDEVAAELARTGGPVDELAARRARRDLLVRRVGVAAAAAAIVGVASLGALNLLSGSDDPSAAGDAVMAESAGLALPPIVRVTDTEYDAESVRGLADDEAVTAVQLGDLSPDEANDLAVQNQERLTLPFTATTGGASADEGGSTTEDSASAPSVSAGAPPADAVGEGDGVGTTQALSDDPEGDAARCVGEILASTDTLIPLVAEVARFDGEPAVIYVFAAPDRDSGRFLRIEIWAVARVDCAVLHFAQVEV